MNLFKKEPWVVDFIKTHYVAVAFDGTRPGNAADKAFRDHLWEQNALTGNYFAYATASGKWLGSDGLGPDATLENVKKVVQEWKNLPESERKQPWKAPANAEAGNIPPAPPAGGMIADAYCVFLERDAQGNYSRTTKTNLAYKPIEPEPDKLWLTESEWKSLVPSAPKVGEQIPVPARIQKRLFSKHLAEYMNGSAGELSLREGKLTLTVEKVSAQEIELRLQGSGKMGETFESFKARAFDGQRDGHGSAGAEVQVLGFLGYDAKKKAFGRFDVVALGESWGFTTEMQRGEVDGNGNPLPTSRHRWPYGIALQLNPGSAPIDRIVPYNMIAYYATPYFEE